MNTTTQPPQGVMAELRELLARATPRPWAIIGRGGYFIGEEADVLAPGGEDIDGAEFTTPGDARTTRGQMMQRDAVLIVAAVNALPGLLDEVEFQRAVVDAARQQQTELLARADALLARCEGLEAFVRELASGGLRFDLTPTHDMSSLNTAEQFWHAYARSMDESIRERAASKLAATRTTGD